MADQTPCILLAGGGRDRNLKRIYDRMKQRGCRVVALIAGGRWHPQVTWVLGAQEISIDGQNVRPQAAFIRHDVFSYLHDRRPAIAFRSDSWYSTTTSWLACSPGVRYLNRRSLGQVLWKPYTFQRAIAAGLNIPATLVSNRVSDIRDFASGERKVVKPVQGGGYCRPLEKALSAARPRHAATAAPAIVQPQLAYPELRVYGVAGRFFGLSINSEEVDYRVSTRHTVTPDVVPHDVQLGLTNLMSDLGLDLCAVDFKTDPKTGQLFVLDVNDMPMFELHDEMLEGAISDAIIDYLQGQPASQARPEAAASDVVV